MNPGAEPGRIASRRIYTGRVLDLDADTVRYPDGSTGELEIFRHPGAAAVVPVASPPGQSDPTILLIRQYRYAAGGFIWEVPAGRLEPGEQPETCARRELQEETGWLARRLERLTTILTTPGFCDEQIHLFAAYELTEMARSSAPGRERDEFLEVAPLALSEVIRMVKTGVITDAKTICAVLFFSTLRTGM